MQKLILLKQRYKSRRSLFERKIIFLISSLSLFHFPLAFSSAFPLTQENDSLLEMIGEKLKPYEKPESSAINFRVCQRRISSSSSVWQLNFSDVKILKLKIFFQSAENFMKFYSFCLFFLFCSKFADDAEFMRKSNSRLTFFKNTSTAAT